MGGEDGRGESAIELTETARGENGVSSDRQSEGVLSRVFRDLFRGRRRWSTVEKRTEKVGDREDEEGGRRGRERQEERESKREKEVRGDAHLLLARLIAK